MKDFQDENYYNPFDESMDKGIKRIIMKVVFFLFCAAALGVMCYAVIVNV